MSTETDAHPAAVAITTHPVLLIASFVTVAALSRLTAVAHGDPDVVRLLLGHADLPAVVLAAVGVLMGPVLAVVAIALALVYVIAPAYVPTGLPILLGLVSIPFVPWGLGLVLVVIPILVAVGWRRRGASSGGWSRNDLAGVIFIAPLAIAIVGIVDAPWVPSENLRLRDETVLRGYVIGESADWLVVLHASTRSAAMIRTDLVESRQPCDLGEGGDERSLLLMITGEGVTDLPRCERGDELPAWTP